MQYKNIIAFIAASAVTAMALPAAVPENSLALEARAEQAKQAEQNFQATQNTQATQATQTRLLQQAVAAAQNGQAHQLTQAQQQTALSFARQQGAVDQNGQFVSASQFWGPGFPNQFSSFNYDPFNLWYYLSMYGNGYDWHNYYLPSTFPPYYSPYYPYY